ncbi:MAG: Glyoxalase/Bleomycin resistance protein/Dioxygenase superfamily protein [Smithella sp. PtaU1.Bin162]|nr:MAG: Glyoxalase/Bleomycin resistance protein/Dioxygenase superfamily protein [Smithella sp. PtaU1.Bin162]
MYNNFHHAHLFAADINASLKFYQEMFGGRIVADIEMAGARNVFLQIGRGRLHFYEQLPRDEGKGAVHHLGIETDNLPELVAHMKSKGVKFRKEIADFGFWKYVMAPAPDNVILELFQPVRDKFPSSLPADFF